VSHCGGSGIVAATGMLVAILSCSNGSGTPRAQPDLEVTVPSPRSVKVLSPVWSASFDPAASLAGQRARFSGVAGLAATRLGLVLVDQSDHQVLSIDGRDGHVLRAIGSFGQGTEQFARPGSPVALGDQLIVLDRDNHRLRLYDLELHHKADYPADPNTLLLRGEAGVLTALIAQGAVYAVKRMRCCDMRPVSVVPLSPSPSQRPRDFAVMPSGWLVVLEGAGDLAVYSPAGKISSLARLSLRPASRTKRSENRPSREEIVVTGVTSTTSDSIVRLAIGMYVACVNVFTGTISQPWRPMSPPNEDIGAILAVAASSDTVYTFQPYRMQLTRIQAPSCGST
jgi:hypothetical protein